MSDTSLISIKLIYGSCTLDNWIVWFKLEESIYGFDSSSFFDDFVNSNSTTAINIVFVFYKTDDYNQDMSQINILNWTIDIWSNKIHETIRKM